MLISTTQTHPVPTEECAGIAVFGWSKAVHCGRRCCKRLLATEQYLLAVSILPVRIYVSSMAADAHSKICDFRFLPAW